MKLPKVPVLSKISVSPAIKQKLPMIAFILIIPIGILVGFFFSNIKGLISGGSKGILTPINKLLYVAKVDGVGIPKSEWEKMLKTRYGQAAAKDLIDIYTVKGELKKAGIAVTEDEITQEITNIEKQLAGQSLEELLKQQGRTLSDFRNDISLQVGMKKLLGGKVVVTDAEVAEYVKSAGTSLEGATDAEKNENAKKALTDQKLSQEVNKWYTDLQSKIKVDNYLL
jgi:hypothetical protein